jgi:hypothetical protein
MVYSPASPYRSPATSTALALLGWCVCYSCALYVLPRYPMRVVAYL